MIPPISLATALRIAPWAIVALLSAYLAVVIHQRDAERDGRIADRAAYAAAQQQARANDLAHARVVEMAQDAVRKEVSDDLETKLGAARADAARHAARLRDKAAQGGGGGTCLPGAPVATDTTAGAGQSPELDAADADACAVAVVKAEGWRDWYAKIEGVAR